MVKKFFVLCTAAVLIGLCALHTAAQTFLPGTPFGAYNGPVYDFSGSTSLQSTTAFTVGYSAHRKGVTFGFTANDFGVTGAVGNNPFVGNLRSYPLRGVWIGGSQKIAVNNTFSATVCGRYFFPTDRSLSEEEYFRLLGFIPFQTNRGWHTDIEWWKLGGEGMYAVWETIGIIGGFRFDSFQTRFEGDPAFVFGGPGQQGNESDFDVYTYLPYVGVSAFNDWSGGHLEVRVIGFPCLPGDVKYRSTRSWILAVGPGFPFYNRFEASGNFKSGYWLQAGAEYGLTLGSYTAGIFAQYELLHGKATVGLDRDAIGQGLPIPIANSSTGEFSLGYDRQFWTVGGNLVLDFGLPL